ncbi:MAG: GGDEF domain-containing protein, partial [Spirochaetia bacterium]
MSGKKSAARSKRKDIVNFEDDPVLRWSESVATDPKYQGEACFDHFLQLKNHYEALLKRFVRVTRISDSYQSSLKELNQSLTEAASRDLLTGLPNRRAMLDELAEQISRAERYGEEFALILADIDDFK